MSLLYEKESYEIRGACFWVWKEFGSAFKESIIDNALTEELVKRGLNVENQKRINIYYNNKKVGVYVPDKIINNAIIIEVKAKPYLTNEDIKQFWHYLKGTKYKLGFLINFGDRLEIRRVVYDEARPTEPVIETDQRVDLRQVSASRSADKGFTLMEIVVSTTIFVIVFMALLSLFNYTLKINRRSEALRQVSQGMRSFIEYLVKEIRNGQVDYYVISGQTYAPQISGTSPCKAPGTAGTSVTALAPDTYFAKTNWLGIINTDGVQECFYYGKDEKDDPDFGYVNNIGDQPTTFSAPQGKNYNLVLQKAGVVGAQKINPPNFRVDNLMFVITPTKDPYTSIGGLVKKSPAVGIFIKFVTKLPTGEEVPIFYQTSVATNQYDIPNSP